MTHALHIAQLTQLNAQTGLPLAARVAVTFAVAVTTWDKRRKSRRTLKHLEPHLLRDIGLDRISAEAEASKPFWRD